mgnify:CR=1 FL=1
MLKELQSILQSFDYDEALDWFTRHVEGKFFVKEVLSSGEDSYNRKKLIEELREIEEALLEEQEEEDPIEEAGTEPAEPSPKRSPRVVTQAASTPEAQQLDEQWKPLYKEANHYFESLGYLATDEECKEAAFKVLDLMDEVEEIWEKKDFLAKHGELPEYAAPGVDEWSESDLIKRRNTLRTYLSKAKNGKLKKENIPTWRAELDDLERRLRK